MQKKIILIEPPTGEKKITTFRYPPMGLLALASYLINEGWEVDLVDAGIDNLSLEEIIQKIEESGVGIVGISSMSVNIGQTFEVAKAVKKNNPNIKVVVGGIHPTVMPEHTLSCDAVDVAVMGEGELTAAELFDTIIEGRDYTTISGIAFKRDGKIIINERRSLIANLDDLPIPIYSLLDLKKYRSPYAKKTPFASIVRSRGCPYHCTFCGNPKMFGYTFRAQTPERTIREIEYLTTEFDIKEISFKDTELTLDPNLGRLCDLMADKKWDLIWSANARVNNASFELFKKMKMAGCYSITVGVESGDQEILNRMKKQITLEQVREAVKMAKQAGLQVVTNFMIGNADDSRESIKKTINFAVELDTDYAYFGFTTPFPGTELRDEAEKNNWILDASMEAIRYDDLMMNATDIPTKELKKYLNIAYRRFYFRPKYVWRRLKMMDKNELINSFEGGIKIIKNNLKIS